jgi:hypothetical protein
VGLDVRGKKTLSESTFTSAEIKMIHMEKIMITIACLLLLNCVCVAGDPPAIVQKAFKDKFPAAANVKWGKENAKEWEAEFINNGVKTSSNFSPGGKWMETETGIPVTALPRNISTAIEKQYPGWNITGAYKIESARKGILYEVEISSGNKKKEVILHEDGSTVK